LENTELQIKVRNDAFRDRLKTIPILPDGVDGVKKRKKEKVAGHVTKNIIP
jgi:hypothetical protein